MLEWAALNTLTEREAFSSTRVGLLSPGNMGAELARHLVALGMDVISPLDGRSDRTRGLARDAGIRDVGTTGAVVATSGIILSLVPPSFALEIAHQVAAALGPDAHPLYVDGNSISPQTASDVAAVVTAAGARFVDASIIGPSPRSIATTRIYACGPDLPEFLEFGLSAGLDVRGLGGRIGRASALKMAYSSLSKGLPAISIGLLLVASSMGLYEELVAELEVSQPDAVRRMPSSLARVPALAGRWIGEAEEIAKTFQSVGLSPRLFEGVADIYRFAAATALASETPETIDRTRSMAQLIGALAAELPG